MQALGFDTRIQARVTHLRAARVHGLGQGGRGQVQGGRAGGVPVS